MFADLLDRAASGAGHRARSARAVGADHLAIHEAGQEHPARALGTRLWSAHRVVAARAYSSSVEVGGDAARFSAETTGLDRCGVAGGEQRSWQSAGSGIDFRGDGGYIIVPPSARMVGNRLEHYSVENVNLGATCSLDAGQLRGFLDPKQDQPRRPLTADRPLDVERLAAWVSRLQEGERNQGLFWAACKMAENDISPNTALDALAVSGGNAGLTEREVTTTVRSAYRTVHGAPARQPSDTALSPSDRPPPASTRSWVLS
ncbi:primase alpha helix C-terminal domain-containing protein [Leucobacter sp. UCD-THU]|uniref:primase alpha helix C-terminal domain-containing protein n=1 Tax=Leucobacter sp. UCD-THU TaxID=1292023 RepID=UPI003A5C80AB